MSSCSFVQRSLAKTPRSDALYFNTLLGVGPIDVHVACSISLCQNTELMFKGFQQQYHIFTIDPRDRKNLRAWKRKTRRQILGSFHVVLT